MNKTDTISGQEGFEIIQRMIRTAKKDFENNSFYNLLWGWLVLVASLGHYILMKAGFGHPYMTWLLMPVGGIVTMVYAFRHERQRKARTYVEALMGYVLTAFLVTLVVVLVFMGRLQENTYPMVMLVYGMWLFVQGGALQFRPLIAGGVVNWVCAVAAFFLPFDVQLLVLAFAVAAGYIVPGYMLGSRFARKESTVSA